LAPWQSIEVPVTFTPLADGATAAVLHVYSNDRDEPHTTVELAGQGQVPVIELEPATWNFDTHSSKCDIEVTITIQNWGSAPLTLDDVVYSASSDDLQLTATVMPGQVLQPGGSAEVTIDYWPQDALPDTGFLHVLSDDPARPDALAVQYAGSHPNDHVVDEFVQQDKLPADILWVVDDSAEMSEIQDELALYSASLFDTLEQLEIDYHVGVVTTRDPALQGIYPFLTPATPDVRWAFANALGVGTSGEGAELGLSTACEAVSSPMTDPGNPNEGFLREDAGLHVIFVTAGDDESPYALMDYVWWLQSKHVSNEHVVISGIFDAGAGLRYEQAVDASSGMVTYLDDPAWPDTLAELAQRSEFARNTFELSLPVLNDTVEVSLDSVPAFEGWHFNSIYNAVVFEPGYAPEPGVFVTVGYDYG